MLNATIIFFKSDKGYGFARPDVLGDDVFVHVNNMPVGHKFASEGDKISYDLGERQGRPHALNIQFIDAVKS